MRHPRREPTFGAAAVVLAMLSLGLIASPCRAQLDGARASAAARALFREGVACADRADWPCAVDHFERSYGLRPSSVIAYNLGMALLSLGRLVEGAEMLGRVLRDAEASETLHHDARRASEAAHLRIARLVVHVSGPLDGVTLTLDGHDFPRELVDAPSPVDPGDHVLTAHRDGGEIARATAHLGDGASSEVSLTIPPAPRATSGGAEVSNPDVLVLAPPPSDDGPWIALGIGGGLLIVGGAITLGVVLGQPAALMPFDGSLGHVEIGR